ncbi:hypothetical protein OS493_022673 [Desmophyllum pertusum]|uniref:Uncharacterized protein n=1 Tax=Desmophyllum pertusum TaxID=174260 RepID=A0A9X0CJZ4_9CNID|nr:hypothetical protein OS493_022673 [Desmophyllum pertusum]
MAAKVGQVRKTLVPPLSKIPVSACVPVHYEWSSEDLTPLKRAKAGELANSNVPNPSDEDITKLLTKKELSLHGAQLYTKTRTLVKGGVELPIYRCARGSTSRSNLM